MQQLAKEGIKTFIVGFNGAEIKNTEEFERSMLTAPVGSVATLRIRRAREEFDIKVPITEAPHSRNQ